MKISAAILIFFSIGFSESPLSERYHTYSEIQEQLFAWNEEFGSTENSNYPDGGIMYDLIEIGKSHEDELPFWAVRLTYNADVIQDKPKILFLGQCHAEEILGVEISMGLIDILLHPSPFTSDETGLPIFDLNAPQIFSGNEEANAFRPNMQLSPMNIEKILEKAEIWVIPTHNPEGLSVVHGWDDNGTWIQDVSYRKNKHDLDNNMIFNFIEGLGNDSDGVDLNRNYDFNWIYGENIYEPDGGGCNASYFTHYDYYRGPEAFSESEIQAIRDLALDNNFLISIAYHSSRSGCLSEKVKYSWEWGVKVDNEILFPKYPPDKDVLSDLGEKIAARINKVDGGSYSPSFSGSFKGVAHNWFYAETGCFQYLIEVGKGDDGGMQPSENSKINSIVHNNLLGAFLAINRTAGINSMGADIYMLSGLVKDSATSLPISTAEVKILEMYNAVLTPRLTDEFGRYRRLLMDKTYTVQVNAIGYESKEFSITPTSSWITNLDIPLEPIPISELNINITDSGNFSGEIFLQLTHSNGLIDTLALQLGNQNIAYPIGDYSAIVFADGKLPQFLNLQHGLTQSLLEVDLKYENSIYNHSLNNLTDWVLQSNNWVNEDWKIKSQADLQYPPNLDQIMILSPNLSFGSNEHHAVKLELQYELEWEVDSLIIQLKNEDGIFSTTVISDQYWDSHDMYIPISDSINSLTEVSFRLITDESVDYRGFILNNLSIMESSESADLSNDISHLNSVKLSDNYPNPFNPSTIIDFHIELLSHVSLSVYNLNGQLIENIIDEKVLPAGVYSYIFDGSDLPSGIYFYKLLVGEKNINKKMLLIK